MKRQSIRKLLLLTSLLLFPVTLYYFSPALIVDGALHGVVNGSCIVFAMMFLLSISFGRLFCGYLCPAGGLQECAFAVNDRKPRQGWRNRIKYVIWTVWIAAVAVCFCLQGEMTAVDFFFATQGGISVADMQGYIIYYSIILLIFVPAVLFGKRVFCHYFCWMAPFMALGTRLRRLLRLPGLHIRVRNQEACVSCGKCERECPMGIRVLEAAAEGRIEDMECIQCGVCVDGCPRKVLAYGMTVGKKTEEASDHSE